MFMHMQGNTQPPGLALLCKDPGISFDLVVLTDATAAIGNCRRRGLRKVRHLAMADRWVQDRVKATFFLRKNAWAMALCIYFLPLLRHLLHSIAPSFINVFL